MQRGLEPSQAQSQGQGQAWVYWNPMNNSTSIPLVYFIWLLHTSRNGVNDRRQQLALITFALLPSLFLFVSFPIGLTSSLVFSFLSGIFLLKHYYWQTLSLNKYKFVIILRVTHLTIHLFYFLFVPKCNQIFRSNASQIYWPHRPFPNWMMAS